MRLRAFFTHAHHLSQLSDLLLSIHPLPPTSCIADAVTSSDSSHSVPCVLYTATHSPPSIHHHHRFTQLNLPDLLSHYSHALLGSPPPLPSPPSS